MKIIKKILNILFVVFMILIIITNLYILYVRVIKKENIIKFFGYSGLIVISGSMEPEININDLIIIKEQEVYNEQDIVTYEENDSLITHRIIEISDNIIITKGDNNNVEDKQIESSQIHGKVIYKVNNFGRIIETINSPIGITIFLAIIFFCVRKTYITKESR